MIVLLGWWKGAHAVEVDEVIAAKGARPNDGAYPEHPDDALFVDDGVILAKKGDELLILGSVNYEYYFVHSFPLEKVLKALEGSSWTG